MRFGVSSYLDPSAEILGIQGTLRGLAWEGFETTG